MKRFGKKFFALLLLAAILLGVGGRALQLWRGASPALGPGRFEAVSLVIDAGHGGEDGGAVSDGGTVESQINLAIALRLDQLCGLFGIRTYMLRDRDISLHDESATTLREKKTSDIHNRVAMVEALEGATLLSIHQNSYTSARYYGAQVFYANTAGSEQMAVLTQETLRLALDPENQRQAKPIPDTVYLMNHVTCRAILVECGFLTNLKEEQQLRSERYQTKVAVALCGAYRKSEEENAKGA